MDQTTEISIKLPLPLDVLTTLTSFLSKVYPDARMSTGKESDHVTFLVDLKNRVPDEDIDSYLASFAPDKLEPGVGETTYTRYGMQPPEWLIHAIGGAAAECLGDAENYVETSFMWKSLPYNYVLTVARSEEQTPAELRNKAEARSNAYAEKLRGLGVDPDSI